MKNITKEAKTLYDSLWEIKDFRRWQWRRHDLRLVLLIVIMAIMSWYNWIRAIWDFINKHSKELIKELKIKKKRLPTFPTIWRILQNVDFKEFEKAFSSWVKWYLWVDIGKFLSLDWKVIRWTVSNPNNEFQKYTNLVSIFDNQRKQVLWVWEVWIDKKSEIPVVRQLIKNLWLTGIIFTIDALHCQKETVKTIVESENDYIIWTKGNQKKLLNNLKKTVKKLNHSL